MHASFASIRPALRDTQRLTRAAALTILTLGPLLCVSSAAGATNPAATPAVVQALGASFINLPSPNGLAGFGYSACGVGDVNADGYSDFAITTEVAGPNGYAAYLYAGGPAGASSTPIWQKENLAHPMRVAAAGDVNGDGFDDVLLYYGGPAFAGSFEVRYGSSSWLHDAADFSQSGAVSFAQSAQTAGDVNGDGYADIVIGEPAFEAAFVYLGSSTGLQAASVQVVGDPSGNLSTQYGISVAGVGDVNGDGYADVAVGAPDAFVGPDRAGVAYIYWGSVLGITGSYSQRLPPPGATDFGMAVAPAGDMNGDGYADVMIGDPSLAVFANYGYAEVEAGSAAGLAGVLVTGLGQHVADNLGEDLFTAGDVNGDGFADALVVAPANGTGQSFVGWLKGHPSQPAYASTLAQFDSFGILTARPAGDVNGDGFGDVLVAGSDYGDAVQIARLYYGQADPPAPGPAAVRYGGETSKLAGWSAAVGDVNGDGFDDVVVGEPWHDAGSLVDAGEIELYLGGPGGIPATPTWSAEGADANGQLGISVAIGGDLNGDGYGDIIAGAHAAGKVFAWYGRDHWAGTSTAPAFVIPSPFAGTSYFGQSIAFAGDLNGDGFADFLIGAPNANYFDATTSTTYTQAGQVLLLLGGSPTPSLASWAPRNAQAFAYEGTSVAGAGDVNSDGYDDFVIGAGSFDDPAIPANVDAGHARLFMGGPGGPSSTPTIEWRGSGPSQFFGNAVAGIGDFNGDGRGDIAIGAYGAPPGGQVYVYGGTPSAATSSPIWTGPVSIAGSAFGNSVGSAGDINGDGKSDLLVGDVFFDGGGFIDCGRASVFLGGSATGSAPYYSISGGASAENVGQCVASGDVNGDGFSDFVTGSPRTNSTFFGEGAIRLVLGNSMPAAGPPLGLHPLISGRPRAAHLSMPGLSGSAFATYDKSSQPNQVGTSGLAFSAGGRDRVRLDWRFTDAPAAEGPAQLLTGWGAMGPPTDPGQGAINFYYTASGFHASRTYGWRVRTQSRSPYFCYSSWSTPQQNAAGQWDFRTGGAALAVDGSGAPGTGVVFSSPWPNPAREAVQVSFSLPRRMAAKCVVRDLQGRWVRTLANGELDAGVHQLNWQGDDEHGRACSAGIYFLDLSAGGEQKTRRVAIVR
ncbi:MAG: FG-GAP-like repeat-containing protein [Candidatus Eiseniibacteriota bacterium]